MKVEIREDDKNLILDTITGIVNHGNKAVIQRKGEGIIIMEESRRIRYKSDDDAD